MRKEFNVNMFVCCCIIVSDREVSIAPHAKGEGMYTIGLSPYVGDMLMYMSVY